MPAQIQLPSLTTAFAPATWAFTAPVGTTTPTHNTTGASPGQRSALERRARLTAKMAKLAATGHLAPLARQISTLGGCAHPIRLTGHRTRLDGATGEILDHFDSGRLPAGELLVRCGNRRATRCPACSTVYRYDTYQLIAAGLRGGKTVPASVAAHPRVFATLTAPGFGPVHNQPDGTGRCRCGHIHPDDDPLLGTPLDPERYDYAGAVLWNAHAPALWARFTTHLRREIAKAAGLTQRALRHYATLSYAKVAEYQKRGQVHFHAVIRLDGPTGPTSTPPAWATTQLLDHAVRAAAARTRVQHEGQSPSNRSPPGRTPRPHQTLRSGTAVGVPVRAADRRPALSAAPTSPATARSPTGTSPPTSPSTPPRAPRPPPAPSTAASASSPNSPSYDITDHARRMIHTAWHLATRPQHTHLRLRQWAHMLGFRGHFSTRTRHYSTTLAHLRAERTAWRTGRPDTQTPASASAETQAGQTDGSPVGDRAGHSTDLVRRSPQHRRSARGLGHDAGHLPLAVRRNRPPTRTRTPRRPPGHDTADPTRATDPNPALGPPW